MVVRLTSCANSIIHSLFTNTPFCLKIQLCYIYMPLWREASKYTGKNLLQVIPKMFFGNHMMYIHSKRACQSTPTNSKLGHYSDPPIIVDLWWAPIGYFIKMFGSTLYIGIGQVQNGHLYLRHGSSSMRTTAKWDQTQTKSLYYWIAKCPNSSASPYKSWEKQTWKFRFCYPSFFFPFPHMELKNCNMYINFLHTKLMCYFCKCARCATMPIVFQCCNAEKCSCLPLEIANSSGRTTMHSKRKL